MLRVGCLFSFCIFFSLPLLYYRKNSLCYCTFAPKNMGCCAWVFSYFLPLLYFRKNSLCYCTFVPKQKYQKFSAQKERWLGQTGINYQLSNFDAGSFLLRNLRCLHQNLHYGFKYILLQLPCADFSPSPRRLTSHIICATPIIGLQQKLPVNLLSGFPDPRRLTSHMSSATPTPLAQME